MAGHLEHVPGLGGGDDDLIALLEQVDAAEGVAVGAPVAGDREVPELSELLGVGVVTRRGLVQDVGSGALHDGHVVVGDAVPLGDDEHPDGLTVADLLHDGRSIVVLLPCPLGGLDLLLVELRGHRLRTGVGVDAGPPQLPAQEEGDDQTGGDEQLTDSGQGAIEDSDSTTLAGCSVSHKTSSSHCPSSELGHHQASGQSKGVHPPHDQPGVVDSSQDAPRGSFAACPRLGPDVLRWSHATIPRQ